MLCYYNCRFSGRISDATQHEWHALMGTRIIIIKGDQVLYALVTRGDIFAYTGTCPRWTYKNQIWHKAQFRAPDSTWLVELSRALWIGLTGSCRRCRPNHLFSILSKSVKEFPSCDGPKMAVLGDFNSRPYNPIIHMKICFIFCTELKSVQFWLIFSKFGCHGNSFCSFAALKIRQK